MIENQIKEFKKSNYVRAAQRETDYWLDFSQNVLNNYRSKFGIKFNLIIYSKIKGDGDFYVIPFWKVGELFKDQYLAKDVRRRSNKRWVANIKNHILKVTNCSAVVDVKDCYCNQHLVNINLNDEENDYAIEDKRQEINVRIKQSLFRRNVLNNFSSKCCISGIAEPELLIASHIIPWAHNKMFRLDPANGLSLFVVYDKLFDNGYFTIKDDYSIQIIDKRDELSKHLRRLLEEIAGTKISQPTTALNLKYLKYHREKIFIERSS